MQSLIERCVSSLGDELVLLAPPRARVPRFFNNVCADSFRHDQLLREMQQLRGAVYLEEGNLQPHQLPADGRHQTPEDEKSWHLLMLAPSGAVRSCALYLLHDPDVRFRDLRLRKSPLVKDQKWGATLRTAVERELVRARREGLGCSELGGWAIHKERRGTSEGLVMALATYGLAQLLGGALGVTTANVAHSCSSILQRLGGSPLEVDGEVIPPYFDHRYNTDIELLRFDSRRPNRRYAHLVEFAKARLANVLVTTASSLETHYPTFAAYQWSAAAV
jgi:hypothetical protein